MYKGNSSRIVPIIVVLIVIAIAVVILVSVGRALFGGNDQSSQVETDSSRQALLNTSLDHSVRMTVRGPIVANEDFRSYQITVSSDSRNLSVYKGYLGQVISSKQFSNNTQAYEQFVYALDKANLAAGTELPDDSDDTRGICATGSLYEFEIMNGETAEERLWTSTCKGSRGSLKASVTQVQNLFLQQIPDSNDLLDEVNL